MNTSFNTRHYTYHIGSFSELNSCCLIYWMNSKTIQSLCPSCPVDSLNLSNLQEIFDIIKGRLEELGMWASRETPDEDFILKSPIDFDHLIYVSESGLPIGFSYFLEAQLDKYKSSEISEMKLNFEFSIENTENSIKLSYTLDPVFSQSAPLLGDLFVTKRSELSEVSGIPKINYVRYTDDLKQLDSSDNFCTITDSGVLQKGETWRLWVQPEISMTRLKDFTDYSIGFLRGDLFLYRWNSLGEYTVDYLSKTNHFGVMEHLSSGTIDLEEQESIRTMSGDIAILDKSGYPGCGYVSLFENHKYLNERKRVIYDPWEMDGELSIIGNNMTSEALGLRHLLEPPGKYYFLSEKRGVWYKFINTQSDTFCWASVYGTAYFKGSEDSRVIPLTDRLILRVSQESIDLYLMDYYGNQIDGHKKYLITDSPYMSLSTNYLENSELRAIMDSFRRQPLKSVKMDDLSEKPCGFRGYLFHLDKEHKILTYL